MAKLGVYKPRNGCALHGAVSTIEEIRGAIPIVHSNQGCAVQNYLANKRIAVIQKELHLLHHHKMRFV